MNDAVPRLVSRADFAAQLGLTVRTLENWEARNYGPRPVRIGRNVRYLARDVDAFLFMLANDVTQAAS